MWLSHNKPPRMAVWHYNDKQGITCYQDFDGLVYQYGYDANNIPDSWLFSRDKLHREVIRTQGRFSQYDVLGRRISQSSHFTQDEHLPEIHTGKLWGLYQYSPADNISHIEGNSRGNQGFYYDAESRLTGSR